MTDRDPDMLPALRALGDNLQAGARRDLEAQRRPAPARRTRRRIVFVVAGALLLAAAVAGAAQLISVGEPLPEHPELRRLAPHPQTPGTLALQAPDPDGGLPWAVRVFTARGGTDCALAGRRRGNQLGYVQGGRFRPLGSDATGACGDLDRSPLVFTATRAPERRAYTLVYGRAHPRVTQVLIDGPDGRRTLRVVRGAFLAVYRGTVAASAVQLRPLER